MALERRWTGRWSWKQLAGGGGGSLCWGVNERASNQPSKAGEGRAKEARIVGECETRGSSRGEVVNCFPLGSRRQELQAIVLVFQSTFLVDPGK